MRRNLHLRILGGVCSGIADHLGCDPIWIRLAFVFAFWLFGLGPIAYLILWLIMD